MRDYPTTPVLRVQAEGPPGARAAALFAQARTEAIKDIEEFRALLDRLYNHATAIAEGGEVYPFGYRETARKMAAEAASALDLLRVTDGKVRRE